MPKLGGVAKAAVLLLCGCILAAAGRPIISGQQSSPLNTTVITVDDEQRGQTAWGASKGRHARPTPPPPHTALRHANLLLNTSACALCPL